MTLVSITYGWYSFNAWRSLFKEWPHKIASAGSKHNSFSRTSSSLVVMSFRVFSSTPVILVRQKAQINMMPCWYLESNRSKPGQIVGYFFHRFDECLIDALQLFVHNGDPHHLEKNNNLRNNSMIFEWNISGCELEDHSTTYFQFSSKNPQKLHIIFQVQTYYYYIIKIKIYFTSKSPSIL